MRIKTTHPNFSNDLIREIVNFVKPSGVHNFDVWVKTSKKSFHGRAYTGGTHFHSRHCPYIVIRIGKNKYPFKHKYPNRKESFPEIETLNEIELLVHVIAHEIRHLWQAKMKNKRGYYPGSKGKFSELDAEMYAIDMVNKWRNRFDTKANCVILSVASNEACIEKEMSL